MLKEYFFLILSYLHDVHYDAIIEASRVYCSNKDDWDVVFLVTALCCVLLPTAIGERTNFFVLEGYLKIFPVFYALQRFYLLRFDRFTPEILQVKTFYSFVECGCFIFFIFFILGLFFLILSYALLVFWGKIKVFKDKKN